MSFEERNFVTVRLENLRLMDVSDGVYLVCWHVTLIKSHVIRISAQMPFRNTHSDSDSYNFKLK